MRPGPHPGSEGKIAMTLIINHTHAEGTLVEGTARGDGSAEALKQNRWRWGRSIGCWFIPHSRDRDAKAHQITQTAEALKAAGFTVEILIDNTSRPVEEVEASKADRAENRATALAVKAERKAAAAESAYAAHHSAVDQLPAHGEPIKVGHHSERRHRRSLDRAHASMGKAVQADREAGEAQRRAEVAGAAGEARNHPVTVARRIQRLEAEERKAARQLEGYQVERGTPYEHWQAPVAGVARDRWQVEADRVAEQLAYWREVRAEQVASGVAADLSRGDISVGDFVQAGNRFWWRVRRVNPKTVTLEYDGCSIKAPYEVLIGHSSAGVVEGDGSAR